MIILPAKLSELTGSSKANSMGSSLANSSRGSTQTRQTSNKDTINHVQSSNNMMQTWYAMRDAICDAYARFDKEWLPWPQLGNPSVPLERWDDFSWKRYKDHRNRSYGLEMASNSNMTPVCDLQQVSIKMQQDEHDTAPKHGNNIHGRDLLMMLNKRWTLSYGQFIH